MPTTPHLEHHFQSSETVRDIVIGMADGLTVPFALAAGLTGNVERPDLLLVGALLHAVEERHAGGIVPASRPFGAARRLKTGVAGRVAGLETPAGPAVARHRGLRAAPRSAAGGASEGDDACGDETGIGRRERRCALCSTLRDFYQRKQ